MKLILTSPTYPPIHNSGLGNVVHQYAKEMIALGHDVCVVTCGKGSYKFEGIDIIGFDIGGSFALRDFIRGKIADYVRFLKQADYDFIIAHGAQVALTDLALLFGERRKIIYFSHGISWKSDLSTNYFKGKIRQINYMIYRFVGPSLLRRAGRAVFLGNGVINDRTFDIRILERTMSVVIPNGSNFKRADTRKFDNKLKVLVVSNASTSKGFERLYKILNGLNPELFESLTICTSSGTTEYHFFRQLFDNSHFEIKINFIIDNNTAELEQFYHTHDIFLHPSLSECYPLVIADAVAVGLPFFAFDTGFQQIIPGGVIARNVPELIEKMNHYAANTDLLKTLSSATVGYTWTDCAKSLNNFLII